MRSSKELSDCCDVDLSTFNNSSDPIKICRRHRQSRQNSRQRRLVFFCASLQFWQYWQYRGQVVHNCNQQSWNPLLAFSTGLQNKIAHTQKIVYIWNQTCPVFCPQYSFTGYGWRTYIIYEDFWGKESNSNVVAKNHKKWQILGWCVFLSECHMANIFHWHKNPYK